MTADAKQQLAAASAAVADMRAVVPLQQAAHALSNRPDGAAADACQAAARRLSADRAAVEPLRTGWSAERIPVRRQVPCASAVGAIGAVDYWIARHQARLNQRQQRHYQTRQQSHLQQTKAQARVPAERKPPCCQSPERRLAQSQHWARQVPASRHLQAGSSANGSEGSILVACAIAS